MTATRTLSKNIISRYCSDFSIIPSRSEWKLRVNVLRINLVRAVWIVERNLKIHHEVLASST